MFSAEKVAFKFRVYSLIPTCIYYMTIYVLYMYTFSQIVTSYAFKEAIRNSCAINRCLKLPKVPEKWDVSISFVKCTQKLNAKLI